MTYEDILFIAKELEESEVIPTKGLTLIYKLTLNQIQKLDLELYRKFNDSVEGFESQDEVEVNISDIKFKFVTE